MPKKVITKGSDELQGQLARALADYDNLKKRTEAEKSVWMKFAKQDLLVKLLPVVDTIELAQKHLADPGLAMSLAQFQSILQEEGIELITTEVFDPAFHEAVEIVDGGAKEEIAEVVLKGYKFNDGTVIRHAKVKVYKGSGGAKGEAE